MISALTILFLFPPRSSLLLPVPPTPLHKLLIDRAELPQCGAARGCHRGSTVTREVAEPRNALGLLECPRQDNSPCFLAIGGGGKT